MTKLCECGCGLPAPIATRTNPRAGHIEGQPQRFILGHRNRLRGSASTGWRGGRHQRWGYVFVYDPGHARANAEGYVQEHIRIVAALFGGRLPIGAVVHHVNRNRADNRNRNLVLCQDSAYHRHLHTRMAALAACGHAGWRKCRFCKRYDDPSNLLFNRKHTAGEHRECRNQYAREYLRRRPRKTGQAA